MILFLLMGGVNSWARLEQRVCAVGRAQGPKWKFCVYAYTHSSRKVLYYFHGIGGGERDWEKHELENSIVRRWESLGLAPPVVVSVSFGPVWLLSEKGAGPAGGLFEFFKQRALPEIRRRVLTFDSEENWLMGVSMGGFNAAQIYFKEPDFFARAAIICGAMTLMPPFASAYTINNYIRRTRAWAPLVWGALWVMKFYLATPGAWARHSPMDLARRYFGPMSKPLYISDGTRDEFGFHEGNIELAHLARDRGVQVQSHFFPGGGHCQVDAKPIADFLMSH